jgi:hypothetical protein
MARLQDEASSSMRNVNARGMQMPDEVRDDEGVETKTIPHEEERVLTKGVLDIEFTTGVLEKGL